MAQVQGKGQGQEHVSALQAAQAALQAALQGQGAGGAVAVPLAKLQAGRAYSLREVAGAVGFTPRKRSNGKQVWAPLRRALRQHVQAGSMVTATVGGYRGVNGAPVGGKAFYMLVSNG